jgi:hypothetical protein
MHAAFARSPRSRVRREGAEVPLPTFRLMASEDPLNRRVVEQMLLGVATRGYARRRMFGPRFIDAERHHDAVRSVCGMGRRSMPSSQRTRRCGLTARNCSIVSKWRRCSGASSRSARRWLQGPIAASSRPLTVTGFELWDDPAGAAPKQSKLRGNGAVPVWFISVDDHQAALPGLTMTELVGMPSLMQGVAAEFEETLHPLEAAQRSLLQIVASGDLPDGRTFRFVAVEASTELRHVWIESRDAGR